jgi:hypothetical protein
MLLAKAMMGDREDILEKYLPISHWDIPKLKGKVASMFQGVDVDPVLGLAEFTDPLTKSEENRRKFIRSVKTEDRFVRLGERWGPALSLVYRLLKRVEGGSEVLDFLDDCGVEKVKDAASLFRGFKKLGDVMFREGRELSKHWMLYVYWNTIGGFMQTPDPSEFVGSIRTWVEEVKDVKYPEGLGGEKGWLKAVGSGIAKTFREDFSWDKVGVGMGFKDFFSDATRLGTTGASQLKSELEMKTSLGGRLKVSNNKWAALARLSSKEVMDIAAGNTPQRVRAIEKSEPAKVRGVLNTDDATYFLMSWLSTVVEKGLAGSKRSTLWMSGQQTADFWVEEVLRCKDPKVWKMPLDQSNFDWMQTKAMVDTVLTELGKVIKNSPGNDEVREEMLAALTIIRGRLITKHSEVRIAGQRVEIRNGVLSGWRWTALIDTLLTLGTLHAVERLVRSWGVPGRTLSYAGQGDDLIMTSNSLGWCIAVAYGYSLVGLDVNPSKFYISHYRNEFLRRALDENGMSGYPLRAVNSILWRKPVSQGLNDRGARLLETMESWKLLADRLGATEIWEEAVTDCVRGTGFRREEIKSWVNTPTVLGGFGLEVDWSGEGYGLKEEVSVELDDVVEERVAVLGNAKGIHESVKLWGPLVGEKRLTDWWNQVLTVRGLPPAGSESLQKVAWRNSGWSVHTPSVGRGVGLSAIGVTTLPDGRQLSGIMSGLWLEELVEAKDDEAILFDWMKKKQVGIYVHSRVGRRVFYDWCLGKLPYRAPRAWGRSGDISGALWLPIGQQAWNTVLTRGWWTPVNNRKGYLVLLRRRSYSSVTQSGIDAERESANTALPHGLDRLVG